jgi:N-acyl-D-amino-acid deacylase
VIRLLWTALLLAGLLLGQQYDIIIRNGLVYDGSGSRPRRAAVAITGDSVAAIGKLPNAKGKIEIDAAGQAIAPGFVNMLSWATDSLARDPRAQSDIRQGVTLEVFGEGESPGPRKDGPTFAESMQALVQRGLGPNVASFVGATTLRINEIGRDDRPPTPAELSRMQDAVRQAMREGALGVGSSLIYAPAFYAKTDELVALCQAAAPFGGMYISHLRSEGNRFLEALDEFIAISRQAGIPAEIYHLKVGGKANWPKLGPALRKIEQARKQGPRITADMYMYEAGATGLDAAMPPWVQEGGLAAWIKRLQDPAIRARVLGEMSRPTDDWENLMYLAGPEGTLLLSFRNPDLRQYQAKTLAEVAKLRGKSPQETAIDLVIEDGSRVSTAYFLMSEVNIQRQIKYPWVALGSDAGAPSAEGSFLLSHSHPRAYGNFARFLGKYVRDQKAMSTRQAVRRLTGLPAANLKLHRRGLLRAGYYADIVVFDLKSIQDHATYEKPHQYATGVQHVFVNGVQVLKDGEPTGAPAGRFVTGPGFSGSR